MKKNKVSRSYFQNADVIFLAKDLIGKSLYTKIDGDVITGGVIVETEAYCGVTDKACHAYNHRRTKRTEVMFSNGGVSYVYFCYGMHYLLNIVTNKPDNPEAILIRAINPTVGLKTIIARRGPKIARSQLTNGPAKVCQALGITNVHSGLPIDGDVIWLEDNNEPIDPTLIKSGPRIGVDYAEEDALKPWRYYL